MPHICFYFVYKGEADPLTFEALFCPSSWATGLCEDLIKQDKGERRYSTSQLAGWGRSIWDTRYKVRVSLNTASDFIAVTAPITHVRSLTSYSRAGLAWEYPANSTGLVLCSTGEYSERLYRCDGPNNSCTITNILLASRLSLGISCKHTGEYSERLYRCDGPNNSCAITNILLASRLSLGISCKPTGEYSERLYRCDGPNNSCAITNILLASRLSLGISCKPYRTPSDFTAVTAPITHVRSLTSYSRAGLAWEYPANRTGLVLCSTGIHLVVFNTCDKHRLSLLRHISDTTEVLHLSKKIKTITPFKRQINNELESALRGRLQTVYTETLVICAEACRPRQASMCGFTPHRIMYLTARSDNNADRDYINERKFSKRFNIPCNCRACVQTLQKELCLCTTHISLTKYSPVFSVSVVLKNVQYPPKPEQINRHEIADKVQLISTDVLGSDDVTQSLGKSVIRRLLPPPSAGRRPISTDLLTSQTRVVCRLKVPSRPTNVSCRRKTRDPVMRSLLAVNSDIINDRLTAASLGQQLYSTRHCYTGAVATHLAAFPTHQPVHLARIIGGLLWTVPRKCETRPLVAFIITDLYICKIHVIVDISGFRPFQQDSWEFYKTPLIKKSTKPASDLATKVVYLAACNPRLIIIVPSTRSKVNADHFLRHQNKQHGHTHCISNRTSSGTTFSHRLGTLPTGLAPKLNYGTDWAQIVSDNLHCQLEFLDFTHFSSDAVIPHPWRRGWKSRSITDKIATLLHPNWELATRPPSAGCAAADAPVPAAAPRRLHTYKRAISAINQSRTRASQLLLWLALFILNNVHPSPGNVHRPHCCYYSSYLTTMYNNNRNIKYIFYKKLEASDSGGAALSCHAAPRPPVTAIYSSTGAKYCFPLLAGYLLKANSALRLLGQQLQQQRGVGKESNWNTTTSPEPAGRGRDQSSISHGDCDGNALGRSESSFLTACLLLLLQYRDSTPI
ncbi:hypothetical protein J6590_010138 [Homalodisca vitripennis]|nr:hypothetical protein J6590_010138 [Homalodisca vitripennis]